MSNEKQSPRLDGISDRVFKRLERYKDLSFLEQVGMFMGKAQILEAGLKGLLARRFGFDSEAIARWTLGKTARELKNSGLRPDYIALLDSVVEYRNYIAHELVANEAFIKSLTGGESGQLEKGTLEKGIYELEQIILLYDWCEEHDAWT